MNILEMRVRCLELAAQCLEQEPKKSVDSLIGLAEKFVNFAGRTPDDSCQHAEIVDWNGKGWSYCKECGESVPDPTPASQEIDA
jgi:hypothetical protein